MLDFDKYDYVIGVDEAGRGSLAGPLVAAAVAVKSSRLKLIEEAVDSKKISPKKRVEILKKLFDVILNYSIVSVPPFEIDKIGLQAANIKALSTAASDVLTFLKKRNTNGKIAVVVDYYRIPVEIPDIDLFCLEKADINFKVVSLASILAKVVRDSLISSAEEIFTCYSFSQHKGYGTEDHLKEIFTHGSCSYHRKSFKPVFQGKLFT